MNLIRPDIKVNKQGLYAVQILEQAGLQVTVYKPGASPIFLVRDSAGDIRLQWCNCSRLVNFANGVSLGVQIGRKLNP